MAKKTTSVPERINLNQNQQPPAFRFFLRWSHATLDSLQAVQEAIKAFADESRDFYLPMPMALPPNLRAGIEAIMITDSAKLKSSQLSLKDDIVFRLRHFLGNQGRHIKPTNIKAAELWGKAAYLLRHARASAGVDTYAETPFTKEFIQGIFTLADEAVEIQSIDYALKDAELVMTSPTKRRLSIEDKVARFKKQYEDEGERLSEYLKAYRSSLRKTKFLRQGSIAKKLHISADQTLGIVTIGKTSLEVSSSAYMVWTILRLVIGSDKEEIPLFKNWATHFTVKNRELLDYIQSAKAPGRATKGHVVSLKLP